MSYLAKTKFTTSKLKLLKIQCQLLNSRSQVRICLIKLLLIFTELTFWKSTFFIQNCIFFFVAFLTCIHLKHHTTCIFHNSVFSNFLLIWGIISRFSEPPEQGKQFWVFSLKILLVYNYLEKDCLVCSCLCFSLLPLNHHPVW